MKYRLVSPPQVIRQTLSRTDSIEKPEHDSIGLFSLTPSSTSLSMALCQHPNEETCWEEIYLREGATEGCATKFAQSNRAAANQSGNGRNNAGSTVPCRP